MRVPLRWLGEFIDLPTSDVDEIAYALDMLGLKVEAVERLEVGWSEVYVGKVIGIAEHPDADKIRVCQVDSGEGSTQIICGAWNFDVGAVVPVARPGAVLPGDFEIGKRTIRGVESNGMICSERELGLGDDHAGILVLDGSPEIGVPFADLVELPDVVFDLEITPNRPDALSLLGIARDLGAWFEVDHRVPPLPLETVPGSTPVTIEVEDATGCRRFTAREIAGVEVGRSPLRMRHRLQKVGVRSISNVVDVTNYVMFELGHPLHAFDADSIAGDRLTVRRAAEGEKLETLDHVNRSLSTDDLIIYDAEGPTSMSGTMGGARSEVSGETTRVLMEAASWDPPTIMHMWRRHDLRSEAATRFERGVDPNLADIANQRASALAASLTGGHVLEGAVDVITHPADPWVVELSLDEVSRLLGDGFEADHVVGILERLGLEVSGTSPMKVRVPTFRPDLTRPADLVEEIARVHGFDKFEATLPTGPAGGLTPEQTRLRRLSLTLTGLGLDQASNLPFVGVDDLRGVGMETDGSDLLTVKNPLREEESKLRPTLLPGLLNAIRYNQSHGVSSVALYETGVVFSATPDAAEPRLPAQPERVAWAAVGQMGIRSLEREASRADGAASIAVFRALAKALDVDAQIVPGTHPGFHPGRTAAIEISGRVIGHVGELSPASARAFDISGRVAVAELELAPLIAPVPARLAHTPSVYPPVDFDLSFLVPADMTAARLVSVTSDATDGLVEEANVFDVFTGGSVGESEKALAIRYRLRASDRTLEQKEIGAVRDRMIAAAAEIGARLRGA